jgi:lipid-A-disaccharide synthase
MKPRLVLIVAGEASADLHGSNLVREMKRLDPELTFWGVGGRMMEREGVRILVSSSEMAVVGLTEVLPRLAIITRTYYALKRILKKEHPDLLILIDYPDFNIRLARVANGAGVPVLYYISPQVWAWRRGRVKKIQQRVDRLAVILPFEETLYRQRGLEVEYVGHPLVDAIPPRLERREALRHLDVEESYPMIGLLPGSRKEEVRNLLPPMVEAVTMLHANFPNLQCLIPRALTISEDLIHGVLGKPPVETRVLRGEIYSILNACDFAFVTSGTATLETAILQVPMVILYRVSPLSYWIGRKVIKVPYIGLPNLVAGAKIVPEIIQDEITPERLVREALAILEDGERRQNMVKDLVKVREKLGVRSASRRTAQIALEMMGEGRNHGQNSADC